MVSFIQYLPGAVLQPPCSLYQRQLICVGRKVGGFVQGGLESEEDHG